MKNAMRYVSGVMASALIVGAGLTCLAAEPAAQPEAQPAPKPAAQPTSQPAKPQTLDELLGLPAASSKPAVPATPATVQPSTPGETGKPAVVPDTSKLPDAQQADLDRLLTGKEMNDAFAEAVTLMGDASQRLKDQHDPGIDTQRVQESIVKKLDQLLASMDKNQQQSSSSSSSQDKPQQGQPPASKPKSSQSQSQQAANPESAQMGPTLQTGKLNGDLGSAQAAWGSLPARIRDMLMQGSSDRFSAKYQAMTEAYYKKLAQEKEGK